MKTYSLPSVLGLALLAFGSSSYGQAGKLILDEDFSNPTLPAHWDYLGEPNSFKIVNGVLEGTSKPGDTNAPSVVIPIEGHNLVVEFRCRFVKKGYFLFIADGDGQFGGEAHLLRFALSGDSAQLAQDRGSLDSKKEQQVIKDQAKKEGKPLPTPTKEQLADPKFYRIETLARKTLSIGTDWHKVRLELNGNQVAAQIDNQPPLKANATVVNVRKTKLVILLSKDADVEIDDLKVGELDLTKNPATPAAR